MEKESNSLLFCDRLREERVRLGFNQDEIASICGVSRVMWGKYERDISEPTSSVLSALANAGADVTYILTGVRTQALPEVSALSRREQALLDNYRHSPDEGQRAIEATASALSQSTKASSKKRA